MSDFKIFIIYMLNFKTFEMSRRAIGKADTARKRDATEPSLRLNSLPAATVLRSSNITAKMEQERDQEVPSSNKSDINPK